MAFSGRTIRPISRWVLFALTLCGSLAALRVSAAPPQPQTDDVAAFLKTYCTTCHNQTVRIGGLALDGLDAGHPEANPEVWEHVLRRLRTGTMPPRGSRRPDASTYDAIASRLEAQLDRAWAANPNPGRSNAVHRLNRTEYNNAIRDLLALDIDVRPLLPGDETADGSFDNFADVLSITTVHLERYLSVARQVTRLATGLPPAVPVLETFEIPLHIVQDDQQSEDLPFGSRGGTAVQYNFPVDGEYLLKIRLRRQYQDYLVGMGWPQQVEIRLDGALLKRFVVGGGAKGRPAAASFAGAGEADAFGDPEWEEYMQLTGDAGLEVRMPVRAGSHGVGVSFVREQWEPEGLPQPRQRGRVITNDQLYMDYAAVESVQIGGPYAVAGSAADTPSRRAIFTCRPASIDQEARCAREILSRMARRAYRRPVVPEDTQTLMEFFALGRKDGGSFEAGIQFALERLLTDPDFLVRVYRDPASASARPYRLSNVELASRLSFFLWSSIPDEPLLDLAERGRLTDPRILEQQVRRMLADPRAVDALVQDFAGQWLNLRRVEEVVVDPRYYPNFDENLLEAFQQETELFIASTISEDRSVLELLSADYTFVNERLARHYGIPGIYGNRFRRITLPDTKQRGGLLAQGAVLSISSYPDRTSPVLRGKWLLDNIVGLPPSPPPADVDTTLDEGPAGARPLSIRERLEQHRSNAVCSSCHSMIDPLGFALESFDVLGGWRTVDEGGNRVDALGTWVNGAEVAGFAGLRTMLLEEREQFARTLTGKLLAYALGRKVEYYDQPAVRQIVRDAAAQDYRWSAILTGIVKSPAFLMRAPGIR